MTRVDVTTSEQHYRGGPDAAAGRVTLVGCGPGDVELLTLRAARVIGAADVLVVDRLVGDDVLGLASASAIIIPVGKEPGGPSVSQDEINRILVREALKGRHVARLKGGDGFVFGRAAEEMAAVRAAGIDVDIVPGITAAHACAASIALPLTLRETVRQFSLVTGVTAQGNVDLDWPALARPGQAFAIYMGVRTSAAIMERLISAGASRDLSIVIVENGTRENEVVVATTLADLAEAVAAHGIEGPAIIFGGLSWEAANLSMPSGVKVFHGEPSAACAPSYHDPRPETL
ncbi:MAG: uroporphyrinogen-III C-methyltransferase [Hyphomicrobium sp.]|nr:uroporphyrinogen-III C-methyltransferase [Hyphomicrobium sp.]